LEDQKPWKEEPTAGNHCQTRVCYATIDNGNFNCLPDVFKSAQLRSMSNFTPQLNASLFPSQPA
jgi:hypothetical protein